jgi:hypothetical protein
LSYGAAQLTYILEMQCVFCEVRIFTYYVHELQSSKSGALKNRIIPQLPKDSTS